MCISCKSTSSRNCSSLMVWTTSTSSTIASRLCQRLQRQPRLLTRWWRISKTSADAESSSPTRANPIYFRPCQSLWNQCMIWCRKCIPFITLPFTFNDELIVVALFNVVFPDTFKWFHDKLIVVASSKVVFPETFNDDTHVVAFFNVVFPKTFNDDTYHNICCNVISLCVSWNI